MELSQDRIHPGEFQSLLSGITATIRDAVVRELIEHEADYVDVVENDYTDPAIDAISKIVDTIQTGRDLKPEFAKIASLVNNQEDRAKLIDSLILTHEYSRLSKFLRARNKIENVLLEVAEKGQLNPTESLAFLSWITSETKQMVQRVRSGGNPAKDVMELLARVDQIMQENESRLLERFSDTSPQAREIVRKLAHKLEKNAKVVQHD